MGFLPSLGDRWYESVFSVIVLLLLAPVIMALLILVLPIMVLDSLLRLLRKEPKPDLPPHLDIGTGLSAKEMADAYVEAAIRFVVDVKVMFDSENDRYVLTSAWAPGYDTTLEYDHDIFSINIAGLNTYSWDTSNDGSSIDESCFWIAIGGLRNGIFQARTKIGRKVFWIKSDELGVWAKIQRAGAIYDDIGFYLEPPAVVGQAFAESITGRGKHT